MKIFYIVSIAIIAISFAFVVPSNQRAAIPINYDQSTTGSYVYHNDCINEDIDVTFRSVMSLRGSMNGQKIILKVHYTEQLEGTGRVSGTRYVGHVNQTDNQSGSLVNGRYMYSQNVSTRLVSQGSGNNFRSNVTVRYSVNADAELTTSREQVSTECQ